MESKCQVQKEAELFGRLEGQEQEDSKLDPGDSKLFAMIMKDFRNKVSSEDEDGLKRKLAHDIEYGP